MKHIIYNSLLAMFALLFLASGAVIGYKVFSGRKAENQIGELKAVFQKSIEPEAERQPGIEKEQEAASQREETLEEQKEKRKNRMAGYEKLQTQNGDMQGWLTIPGTYVDYPVMQSAGRPDYYLKRDFKGQKSNHGTPYIAEGWDPLGGEDNIVIYGHHMKDGTMFADLMKYTDKDFYTGHRIIWFDTPERVTAYEVIGVTKASAAASEDEKIFTLAADKTKRQQFLGEVARRSLYDTGQIGGDGEKGHRDTPLLVLITCEYTQDEGRFLVVAREVSF